MSAGVEIKQKWAGFRIRPFWVLFHRWFGIIGALWLALMGVTGSIIVFYTELDTLLNSDLMRVEPEVIISEPDTWFAAANSAFPNHFIRLVNLPDTPTESVYLNMVPRPGSRGTETLQVFINPYTAEILGSRPMEGSGLGRRGLMNFIYGAHLDLHMGPRMMWFLGLISLFWLLDHFISAALSFPTLKKWTRSFRVRGKVRGHKFNFDLHRAGGLWFWPVTFVLALSGVYLTWYTPVIKVVDAVSPVTQRAIFAAPALKTPVFDPALSYADAERIAQSVHGKPKIDLVGYIPTKGLYELRAFDARDIDGYGRRMIVVDGFSGEIISDRHITDGSAGDVFLAWQYPLHSGKGLGSLGRALVFLSGIITTLLCVTGLLIWAKKRQARKRRIK